METSKPKVKLRLHVLDWSLELLSAFLILILLLLPIFLIGNISGEIPIHFNLLGEPDIYGSKHNVWAMVIIGLFIYVSITILNFYPAALNYPVQITKKNAEDQYKLGTLMLRWIKLLTLGCFVIGIIKMMFSDFNSTFISKITVPVLIVGIFVVMAFFFYKMIKSK